MKAEVSAKDWNGIVKREMSTNVNGLSNTSGGEEKRSHQNRFTVAVFQYVSAEEDQRYEDYRD